MHEHSSRLPRTWRCSCQSSTHQIPPAQGHGTKALSLLHSQTWAEELSSSSCRTVFRNEDFIGFKVHTREPRLLPGHQSNTPRRAPGERVQVCMGCGSPQKSNCCLLVIACITYNPLLFATLYWRSASTPWCHLCCGCCPREVFTSDRDQGPQSTLLVHEIFSWPRCCLCKKHTDLKPAWRHCLLHCSVCILP